MNKKKIGIIAGVVVGVAAVVGAGVFFSTQVTSGGNSENRVYVEQVSSIMSVNAGMTNRYNGVMESQDTYEVTVDTERQIEKIHVEVGQEVSEGQTLVTYDVSDQQLKIDQAKLELESITNDINNHNVQLVLKTNEFLHANEYDRFYLNAEIQGINNAITQCQLDLQSKQLEIDKMQKQMVDVAVISEKAGTVTQINPKGIDPNGNPAPFMTIMQSGEYRVKGSIDEQNIWTIAEGQPVLIRSRVDETKTWNGVIALIDTENPEQNNNNYYGESETITASKYPFYIELEAAEGLILGQHVYIELDFGQQEEKEGIWLSSSYVVQEDDTYVWAANGRNRLEKRVVELGEYDESMDEYQIVSGLTEEDYIAWPMYGLYEGVTTVTDMAEQYWEVEEEFIEGDTMIYEEIMPDDMMMDGVMTDDMMVDENYGVMDTEFVEEAE